MINLVAYSLYATHILINKIKFKKSQILLTLTTTTFFRPDSIFDNAKYSDFGTILRGFAQTVDGFSHSEVRGRQLWHRDFACKEVALASKNLCSETEPNYPQRCRIQNIIHIKCPKPLWVTRIETGFDKVKQDLVFPRKSALLSCSECQGKRFSVWI